MSDISQPGRAAAFTAHSPAAPGERRSTRLMSAVRGILGVGDVDDTAPADAPPPPPDGRDLFERIGTFLFTNQLEPLPSHYELAHAYMLGINRRLVFAVDRAIERDGILSDEVAEAILVETRTDLSAVALSKLVDEAQIGLASVAGLVKQSGADAQAYGEALEDKVAGLAAHEDVSQSLNALVFLTRAMIEKTRSAEQQLRQTSKKISALRSNLVEARRLADSDQLTGLPNRRAFDGQLARAVSDARAHGRPLSLAFCDIDNFKKINDSYGHEIGDRVLKYVAKLLREISNDKCHVARHGGEEFVVLFENMEPEKAYEVIDAARRTLAARRLAVKDSGETIGQITFSAGVAALSPTDKGRDMLRLADQALYRAKHAGRDQVVLA
jgi:diguanylate cyclase